MQINFAEGARDSLSPRLFLSVSVSVSLFVCLSARLSFCPPVGLSLFLSLALTSACSVSNLLNHYTINSLWRAVTPKHSARWVVVVYVSAGFFFYLLEGLKSQRA